jgi:hypothetical protein
MASKIWASERCRLEEMKNEDMVLGMNFPIKSNDLQCETCAKCKIRVQPFTQSVNREKELLGLVLSDIRGPIGTESLGGAKYFVTFIDCSRYTETAMLRSRADVLQAFKDYKRKVENYTGRKLRSYVPTTEENICQKISRIF